MSLAGTDLVKVTVGERIKPEEVAKPSSSLVILLTEFPEENLVAQGFRPNFVPYQSPAGPWAYGKHQ